MIFICKVILTMKTDMFCTINQNSSLSLKCILSSVRSIKSQRLCFKIINVHKLNHAFPHCISQPFTVYSAVFERLWNIIVI